ncbi:unnamed protein product [Trichogramma brassicae]|uniref:Uncharacterized protein n=1 Tax=Trichogramma brassicae TaxID=86971 RepID=A0A6H5IBH3_9HYME|nr:unnamed protein product [Trichogramma brassicae]
MLVLSSFRVTFLPMINQILSGPSRPLTGMNNTSIRDFFSNIHVPLDCIFLVVQKFEDSKIYVLTEVYSIDKGRELITNVFGTWEEESGLEITKLALYQRRSNLQGQLIRVTTVEVSTNRCWARSLRLINVMNYYLLCRTFIKRPQYAAVKWTAYSDPFYGGIWLCILIIMLLSSGFILISFKTSPSRFKFSSEELDVHFLDTFFHIFGDVCSQGSIEVDIDPIRIIHLVIHFTGVILVAAYSAALISFLAVKVFVMPFTTMLGLLEDGSYKFGVVKDSADYGFFQTTSDKVLQRMFSEILDEVEKLPNNYLEGLSKVCTEKDYAFMITDNMFAILEHLMTCILEPLEPIMQTTLAMGVQKRSPFRGIINSKNPTKTNPLSDNNNKSLVVNGSVKKTMTGKENVECLGGSKIPTVSDASKQSAAFIARKAPDVSCDNKPLRPKGLTENENESISRRTYFVEKKTSSDVGVPSNETYPKSLVPVYADGSNTPNDAEANTEKIREVTHVHNKKPSRALQEDKKKLSSDAGVSDNKTYTKYSIPSIVHEADTQNDADANIGEYKQMCNKIVLRVLQEDKRPVKSPQDLPHIPKTNVFKVSTDRAR